MKYSVIVLLYNSNLEKIYLTLKSIVCQTLTDIEIVIADDGSQKNYYEEVEEYLLQCNFRNVKFTPIKKNVGTVRNILDGLRYAEGKYVRLIGAGDLLFNEHTLQQAYEYMERTNSKVCFGRMMKYSLQDGNLIYEEPFVAPKDLLVYQKKRTKGVNYKIRRNVLLFGDWISGASIFYEKNLLEDYLNGMKEYVKYCEDLITAKLVLDGVEMSFIDHFVTWYEVGEGISTSINNSNALKRVLTDQNSFYDYLISEYQDNMLIKGKKILQYNNKAFLFKNRLKRIIEAPSRVFFALEISRQKKRYVNDKREEGFLNYKDW